MSNSAIFSAVLLLVCTTGLLSQSFPALVPESSNYRATSRYADVMQVVDYVARHYPNVSVEYFATSLEGKKLPLLIFSDRKIVSPDEAQRLGRPIALLLGNIHAGEVEGKEATLILMREILEGKHDDDLKSITLLIIPIYNADSNDKILRTNRISQNGPVEGVGVRANSQGFDLNRDLMKLESIEARGLVRNVYDRWDPTFYMELHTTDGSFHGYHLTWANGLNPDTDSLITNFQVDKMMPEVTRNMLAHGWRIFPYGDYRWQSPPDSGWFTFSHQPRYGTNYYPLRNRMALLSETYSYVDFENRIKTDRDFINETISFFVTHKNEVMKLVQSLKSEYSKYQPGEQEGVTFTWADPVMMKHWAGSVDTVIDPETGLKTFEMRKEIQEMTIPVYDRFKPVLSRPVPVAYAIDNHTGQYNAALENLTLQGIPYSQIESDEPVDVLLFKPSSIKKAS
ncbi:MAG TPA: M14 family metallopeptidase, partial [Bacteroidota bacterium]|nr:M14 family metallopeptidase [Bacteroidota bacterium]